MRDRLKRLRRAGPFRSVDKGKRIMKMKTLIAGIAIAGFVASFAAPTLAAGSGSGSGTTVAKPKPKKKKKTSEVPAFYSTVMKAV